MADNDQPTHRRSPSPRRPVPAHWKELMDRRGISSVRQLAARSGLTQPPVNNLVYGDGKRPTEDTLAKVAGALDIPLADVYWLAGQEAPHAEQWTPPAEANRMTPRQRAALEELIRAMVDPGERAQAPTAEPSNVRHLPTSYEGVHPEDDELDVAADRAHGPSEGQLRWEHMNGLGEESQDPEDGRK